MCYPFHVLVVAIFSTVLVAGCGAQDSNSSSIPPSSASSSILTTPSHTLNSSDIVLNIRAKIDLNSKSLDITLSLLNVQKVENNIVELSEGEQVFVETEGVVTHFYFSETTGDYRATIDGMKQNQVVKLIFDRIKDEQSQNETIITLPNSFFSFISPDSDSYYSADDPMIIEWGWNDPHGNNVGSPDEQGSLLDIHGTTNCTTTEIDSEIISSAKFSGFSGSGSSWVTATSNMTHLYTSTSQTKNEYVNDDCTLALAPVGSSHESITIHIDQSFSPRSAGFGYFTGAIGPRIHLR